MFGTKYIVKIFIVEIKSLSGDILNLVIVVASC